MHLETSSHPYAPFQKARFARAANACLFGTLSLTLKPLILESSVRYPYWQSNTFGFMERRDSGNRKSGSPHTVLWPVRENVSQPDALRLKEIRKHRILPCPFMGEAAGIIQAFSDAPEKSAYRER